MKAPIKAEITETTTITAVNPHSPEESEEEKIIQLCSPRLNRGNKLPIVLFVANIWSLFVAQEHMPHVVRPSDWAASSRKGGLGGGGTKLPLNNPLSEASKASGELKVPWSSPAAPPAAHHESSLLSSRMESSGNDGDMLLHLLSRVTST